VPPPAAERQEAHEAVLADRLHEKADLVEMAREHHLGSAGHALLLADEAAEPVA
jgi:hypothetical protein